MSISVRAASVETFLARREALSEDMHTMIRAGHLMRFELPNLYFHVSTAYALLRRNGLPVGKRDFFGGI